MSETTLNHGYVPEEHAPDPVLAHGDPTPPGKVAIWLFLASEIMLFIGILGKRHRPACRLAGNLR